MIYKTAVAMRRDQFERVNRLLKIWAGHRYKRPHKPKSQQRGG